MSERVLVLSADAWSLTDEKTGEVRSGFSVWYVNDYREDTETQIGMKPTKITATEEILKVLKSGTLPALFDLDFASRPGAGGKATLTLIRAKHIRDIDLFAETEASSSKSQKVAA